MLATFLPASSVFGEPPTASIIDGTPVNADDYPYVSRIEYQGDILCTGTLIGSHHVLTAAHCFYDNDGQRSVRDTDLTLRFGSGLTVRSTQVFIHPSYRARESACIEGEVDAAVVVLAREVSGISPIPMVTSSVSAGDSVFLAGFGTQGSGQTGEDGTTPDIGTINVGSATVDGFGDDPPAQSSNSLYFHWKFIPGESNTGSGDSGGPAFSDIGGQRYLAGITCGGYGNSEYDTYSLDTRVEQIKSWVDTHLGSAPPQSRSVNIKAAELYFNKQKGDYLYLRGQLEVGSGFKPRGKTLTVKIGNYTRKFKLDADAESGNSKSYLGLTGAYRGAAFKSSTVRYDMEFERLPVFQELPGFGFPVSSAAVADQEAVIPLSITVDGIESSTSSILVFKSRGKVWKVKPGQ